MKIKLNIHLALVTLSLASAALGCGVFSAAQNPASNPGNIPQTGSLPAQTAPAAAAPNSSSVVADPDTTVHNVLTASLTAPAYHTTVTITSTNSVTEMVDDVILPDRFHITSTRNGKTSEMIIVAGKTYVKTNGAWVASTADMSALTTSFTGVLKDTTISDAKFVKPDVVDGKPALVYSYTSLYKSADMEVTTTTMMWVDPVAGLPVKMVEDSVVSGIKSHIEQTVAYDPTITIEAPTP
jgi:hypothetical protein